MTSLTSINPATLEPVGEIACTAVKSIPTIIASARTAGADWLAMPFCERARILLRVREMLLHERDTIAALITAETGKPLVESFTAEIFPSADLLHFFATHAEKFLRNESLPLELFHFLGRRSRVTYQPLGVIGIIAPWNFPLAIPLGSISAALLCGNSVLFKSSELTPLVGEKLCEIFHTAGVPRDALIHLVGDGAVGAALCAANVEKIYFTGSVATGQRVMTTCAQTPKPCVLELGGNDAMIVCADANLDIAARGAVWGAFTNAGQCCASVERVFVDAKIADAFLARVVALTKNLRIGLGTDPNVDVGPLITAAQRAIVETHVADAITHGAVLHCGGARASHLPGYFYQPTVLSNVTPQMRIMREETFGPALPIMQVASIDEAIALTNDSPFGLTASIWSRDLHVARKHASRLDVGTVMINECLYTHALPATPWGGCKQSGFGRTHGHFGLHEFVRPLHIHTNRTMHKSSAWWFPYSPALLTLFRRASEHCTRGIFAALRSPSTLWKMLRAHRDDTKSLFH